MNSFKLEGLRFDDMEAARAAAPGAMTTLRFSFPRRQPVACTHADITTRMHTLACMWLPFWSAAVEYAGAPKMLSALRAWQEHRHGVREPARGMVLVERTHVSRIALGEELTLHALGLRVPDSPSLAVGAHGVRTRGDPAPPCPAMIPCNGQAASAAPWDTLQACRCGLVVDPPLKKSMAQKRCKG